MKRLLNFLYGNWYGMSVCWCATGLLSLAVGLAFGGDRRLSALVNAVLFLHVIVMTLLALSAPIVSLCRRKWGRACAQIGAGFLLVPLYLAGLSLVSIAAMFSKANMDTFRSEDQPWRETKITDELPFSVGYRPAHPFLAEYEKRLAFRSGKRVALRLDSGGAGDFAVYALGPDSFYLVEGLEHEFMRCEYRVNVKTETVEMLCGDVVWVQIPDDTLEFESWGADGFFVKTPGGRRSVESGVPAEGTLEGRRFLGYITRRGKFNPGGEEPNLPARPGKQWEAFGSLDQVPVSVEREKLRSRRGVSAGREFLEARVVLPSGRNFSFWSFWSDEPYWVSVYGLAAGGYLLVPREGKEPRQVYRVDPAAGTLDCLSYGHWVRVPDDAFALRGMGPCSDAGGGAKGSRITVSTPHGKRDVQGTEPEGTPFLGARYLGRIGPDGSRAAADDPVFAEALARTKVMGASWNAKAELDQFNALFDRLFKERLAELTKHMENSPDWVVAEERNHRCAFRILHAGDETVAVRLNLNGKKPGSSIAAKGRCRNHEAGWYAAAKALVAELEGVVPDSQ